MTLVQLLQQERVEPTQPEPPIYADGTRLDEYRRLFVVYARWRW